MKKTRTNLRRALLAVVAAWLIYTGDLRPEPFLLGAAIVLLGQAFQLWSYAYLVKNTQLTTRGPYQYVRNPFYLGTFLCDLGICIVSGCWMIGVVYMTLFFAVYHRRVIKEEQALRTRFPKAFEAYAKEIPRFVPRLRPFRQRDQKGGIFDPSLIIKNRVIPRILNLWIYLVCVVEIAIFAHRGDTTLSMDHLVIGVVCVVLFCISKILGIFGISLKKAPGQHANSDLGATEHPDKAASFANDR